MEAKRNALCPVPPRPRHAELNLPICLANDEIVAAGDEPSKIDGGVSFGSDESGDKSFQDMDITPGHRAAPSKESRTKARIKVARQRRLNSRPEVMMAEDWMEKWHTERSPTQKCSVSPSQLRAYSLWHEQQIDVSATAAILRDPPLKKSTVAAYVLDAIRLEQLPFEKGRIMPLVECLHLSARYKYDAFLKRNGIGNT